MNEIGKWNRSIRNRIQSILEDAEFVECVKESYGLPLVPNKRCGLWYVRPEHILSTSYFKSTDGHTDQWSFSLKRLNLHLLPLIFQHNGVILVDSTRRGKRMPDAFSKTVPIWCAVMNTIGGFPGQFLNCPRGIVSPSEQDQISQMIPQWVETVKNLLGDLVMDQLKHLDKPLRPIWVTPDGLLPQEIPEFPDFYPLVLCTASRKVADGADNALGYVYIQGAADDHELWAGSLDAPTLWKYPSLQENVPDHELKLRIDGIRSAEESSSEKGPIIRATPSLSIAYWPSSLPAPGIVLDFRFDDSVSVGSGRWPIEPGKLGFRALKSYLRDICAFYEIHRPSLILGSEGSDAALCVAYMIDCLYYDDDGQSLVERRGTVSKAESVRRLAKISSNVGTAPSRASINVIGTFMRP